MQTQIQTQVARCDPDAVWAKVEEEISEMHSEYDKERMKEAARVYMEAINKDGHIFDFDLAWKWAEYSAKHVAKDVIRGKKNKNGSRRIKPLLRENIDYKIIPEALLRNTLEQNTRDGRGGHNKEKIMLTARGFNQFVLAARTPVGQILRDVVFSTMRIVKQLQTAVQTGTHRIVRVRPDNEVGERDAKRLKVCDTQKALMREMVDTNPDFARFCARVNGETNKAVTGRYKYELARELNMPPEKVNTRDYMTELQLALTEAVEILSREKLKDSDDPLATHKDICERMTANIKDELHGKIADYPRNLRDVRSSTVNALPPPAPAPVPTRDATKEVVTIKRYFTPK